MIRIRNTSRRLVTVELATDGVGCYAGRRGDKVSPAIDILPGGVSGELPDAVKRLPGVIAKRRRGLIRIEAVPTKPKPKAKAQSKPKASKGRKKKSKGTKQGTPQERGR